MVIYYIGMYFILSFFFFFFLTSSVVRTVRMHGLYSQRQEKSERAREGKQEGFGHFGENVEL